MEGMAVQAVQQYIRGRGWGRGRALGGTEAGDGVVAGTAVRGVRGRCSETFTSLCRSPASPPPRRPMGAPLKPFFLPPPLLDLQARLEDSEQAKQALVLAGTRRQQEMERQLEQVKCGGCGRCEGCGSRGRRGRMKTLRSRSRLTSPCAGC